MNQKPHALIEAEVILSLCERFGCLPSQLLAEDAEILRYLAIEAAGRPVEMSGGDDGW